MRMGYMEGTCFTRSVNVTKQPQSINLESVTSSCLGDELKIFIRGPWFCSLIRDNRRSGGAAAWVIRSAGLCLESRWALKGVKSGEKEVLQHRPSLRQECVACKWATIGLTLDLCFFCVFIFTHSSLAL